MITHLFIGRLRAADPQERVIVIAPLVRAYLSPDIGPVSREEIGAALVGVLDDPNPIVRRALADALAGAPAAPHHLVRALANDQLDVATPVLARSPALRDYDLVELVGEGDGRVQTLIAGRARVSAPVAAALIEVAGPRACRALVENPGADILPHNHARLAERFAEVAELRAAMLERPDLPVYVRQGLTLSLCEALGNSGMFRSLVRPERARRVIRDAWEKATVDLATRCDETELDNLVVYLHASERLSMALILRALVEGDWRFFVAALGRLSGLPHRRVERLAGARRGPGFQALYRRAGLPPALEAGVAVAVAAVREAHDRGVDLTNPGQRIGVLEAIIAAHEEIGADALDDLNGLFVRLLDDTAREMARTVFWQDATAA